MESMEAAVDEARQSTLSSMYKNYTVAFSVDGPKLLRLVNIIRAHYDATGIDYKITYQVALRNGRLLELSSVDELLELDNRIQDPIVSLYMTLSEWHTSKMFERSLCVVNMSNMLRDNVQLYVRGRNIRWVSQTFSEIEEQLERTFLRSMMYRLKSELVRSPSSLLLVGLMAALIILMLFIYVNRDFSVRPTMTPDTNLFEELEAIGTAGDNAITTEEKADFVFQSQKLYINWWRGLYDEPEYQRALQTRLPTFVVRNALVFIPLFVILGLLVYLMTTCYPRGVFLWGDYLQHNESILERRKNIWYSVIVALVVNLVTSFWVSGILAQQ